MTTIRNGVMSYAAENNGNFPTCIPEVCESADPTDCSAIDEEITSTDIWHADNSATISECWPGDGSGIDAYLNQEPTDPQQDGGTPTYWLRIAGGNNLQVISTATEWTDENDDVTVE
jgi:hypothetical protein